MRKTKTKKTIVIDDPHGLLSEPTEDDLREVEEDAPSEKASSVDEEDDHDSANKYYALLGQAIPFTVAEEQAAALEIQQRIQACAAMIVQLLMLSRKFLGARHAGRRPDQQQLAELYQAFVGREVADIPLAGLKGQRLADAVAGEASRLQFAFNPDSLDDDGPELSEHVLLEVEGNASAILKRFGDQAGVAAVHEFTRRNLRLVASIARKFNFIGRVSMTDLIQEGNIGLMKAVGRFDPQRGWRFSTYASWWIRHAIQRHIADHGRTIRIPVHMLDSLSKLGTARRELRARLGRIPEHAELAQHLGLTVEKIDQLVSVVAEPVSLATPIETDGPRHTLVDFVADHATEDTTAESATLADERMSMLRRAIESLTPFEQLIIRTRFGLGEQAEATLEEIGERHKLSRERIRQIQVAALKKLRLRFTKMEMLG